MSCQRSLFLIWVWTLTTIHLLLPEAHARLLVEEGARSAELGVGDARGALAELGAVGGVCQVHRVGRVLGRALGRDLNSALQSSLGGGRSGGRVLGGGRALGGGGGGGGPGEVPGAGVARARVAERHTAASRAT